MEVAEEFAQFIPFIGSFIAAPLSVASCRYVLFELIEKSERVSMKVAEYKE